MSISLSKGDWTKLRQIIQRIIKTRLIFSQMKTGTSQTDAKAAKDELWADSNNDYTVKLGR